MIHAAFSEKPTISVGSTETPLGKVKKKKKYMHYIQPFLSIVVLQWTIKRKELEKKWVGDILSNLLNICLS